VKFLAITLIVHAPDPVTGVQKSTNERFRGVVDNALLAEELGFDGFGVGERHERPFISSSPPVVLSHIAALTSRIRLFTAVTTLSLLDPVRAYEDYATLDHLSAGRLDLIIGKGNGTAQRELFHVTPEDQWDRNAESYELFRRIWQQDKVSASPRFRPELTDAEVWPRPLQQPIRVWHGSATSRESVDLAARYGDPLFSANVTHPIEPYAELIRYYRERWEHYGHDPARAVVGAGTAGYYAARTSQRAGVRHHGGLRRTQFGADRQPSIGHRQVAPLPRAVRTQRAPPARRRRRAQPRPAPCLARTLPVRHRPGSATRHPRPAVPLGSGHRRAPSRT
jgi:alkanesulfonate monooxygenase SsuD/methylene tetrahydromethanopterin reductase-like flavin-dependent oxidoreductase (luciferase family)